MVNFRVWYVVRFLPWGYTAPSLKWLFVRWTIYAWVSSTSVHPRTSALHRPAVSARAEWQVLCPVLKVSQIWSPQYSLSFAFPLWDKLLNLHPPPIPNVILMGIALSLYIDQFGERLHNLESPSVIYDYSLSFIMCLNMVLSSFGVQVFYIYS